MNRFYLALLVMLAAALPAGSHAQSSPPPAEPAPMLQPGDAVKIMVWRRPELSGEFAISSHGTISHPLLREVRVVGVPLHEAEQRVRAYLQQLDATPQFVVEPLLRVAVGGEVRQPNLYALPPETSVAQAVALAGGATPTGRLDRVRLLREGEERLLDLTHPDTRLAQLTIRSGDQILVERRRSVFREYIVPAASLTAAAAAVLNVVLRYR